MDISAIIEAMKNPEMRHAALVHLPIALSAFGVILILLSLFMGGKSRAIAWTATGAYILLAGLAYITMLSGESAQENINIATTAVNELVHEHEEKAEVIWVFALGVALLLLLASVTREKFRAITATLGLLGGLFTGGWVAFTAHDGGMLVYSYGAGTPIPGPAPAAAPGNGPGSGSSTAGQGGASDEAEEVAEDPRLALFRERVKPLLRDVCIKCHNPSRMRRSGDLDQTTMEGLLTGGMSGPAVVPGDPDASWLIKAVRHEEDLEMPPKKPKLPDDLIGALEQWVLDGAVWEPLGPPTQAEEGEGETQPPASDSDDGDDADGDDDD